MCDISHIYVTLGEAEEEIYPPTIAQIAEEQRISRAYKPYFKSKIPKKVKLDRRATRHSIDVAKEHHGLVSSLPTASRRDAIRGNPSKPLCIGQV